MPEQDEVFESLSNDDGSFVSGSAVREWALQHPFGVDLSTQELATAWDLADRKKRGKLDRDGFGLLWRELDARSRRKRAKEYGVSVASGSVSSSDESGAQIQAWTESVDAATASEVVALVCACSSRVNDGEYGEWRTAHLQRTARALGLKLERTELEILCGAFVESSQGELVDHAERTRLLSDRLRDSLVEPLVAKGLVAVHVASSTYDARARRIAARVASALGYPRDWLARVERGIAEAVSHDSQPSSAAAPQPDTSTSLLKYAKIGGVGLAAAATVAFTAGLAAPVLAAALATSTVWGASALVAFAGTYSMMFALTFGAAGGGLAGYRMQRRVAGLTDFEFKDDDERQGRALAIVIGVTGSMRHVHDHSVDFGLAPPIDKSTLTLRTKRAVSQLCETTDSEWITARANDVLASSTSMRNLLSADDASSRTAAERAVANRLFGDPDVPVDAKRPPDRTVDVLGERAKTALDAAVKILAVDDPTTPFDQTVLDASLQVAADTVAVVETEGAAADQAKDNKEPGQTAAETPVVAKASQLFQSAFLEAKKDAEEEDSEEETVAADSAQRQPLEQQRSKWNSLSRVKSYMSSSRNVPVGDAEKTDTDEAEEDHVEKTKSDVPLWWWRRDFGEKSGSEMHCLIWERSLLVEVTGSMKSLARSLVTSGAQESLVLGASASAAAVVLSTLVVPLYLIQATKYIDRTWTIAVERADAAGVALADALCATDQIGTRPATLIGYSLGARVVFKCLETLASRHEEWLKALENRNRCESGTLWLTALDGVHWLDTTLTRARIGVIVHTRSPTTITSSRLSLLSEKRKAAPGEPIIWFDPRANTDAKRKPDLKLPSLPDDAILEIVLVDDSTAMFSGWSAADNLKVLARAEVEGWVKNARHSTGSVVDLAPLHDGVKEEPRATVRLDLRWTADGADAPSMLPGSGGQNAGRRGFCGIVEHAIICGAPLKAPSSSSYERRRWEKAASVVSGQFCNAYSSNDLMLAIMFRSQSLATRVAGLSAVNIDAVRDVDVSRLVSEHSDYPSEMYNILNAVDFDNPDLHP